MDKIKICNQCIRTIQDNSFEFCPFCGCALVSARRDGASILLYDNPQRCNFCEKAEELKGRISFKTDDTEYIFCLGIRELGADLPDVDD